jgi:hypothetical protein
MTSTYAYEELEFDFKPGLLIDGIRLDEEDPTTARRYILIKGPETITFMTKRIRRGVGSKSKLAWSRWEDVGVVRFSFKQRGQTDRKLNIYSRHKYKLAQWSSFWNSSNDMHRLKTIIPSLFLSRILQEVEDMHSAILGKPHIKLKDFVESEDYWNYLLALIYPAAGELESVRVTSDAPMLFPPLTKFAREKNFNLFSLKLLGKKNYTPEVALSLKSASPTKFTKILAFKNLVRPDVFKEYILSDQNVVEKGRPIYRNEGPISPEHLRRILKAVTPESRELLFTSTETPTDFYYAFNTLLSFKYNFKLKKFSPNSWGELRDALKLEAKTYERDVLMAEDLSFRDLVERIHLLNLDPKIFNWRGRDFSVTIGDNSTSIINSYSESYGATLYLGGRLTTLPKPSNGKTQFRDKTSREQAAQYMERTVAAVESILTSVKAEANPENISKFLAAVFSNHLTGVTGWNPNPAPRNREWYMSDSRRRVVAHMVKRGLPLELILCLAHLNLRVGEIEDYTDIPNHYIFKLFPKNFFYSDVSSF